MPHRVVHNPGSALRIALVASSFTRDGAEKQFFYACRSLSEAGTTARVYGFGPRGYYSQALEAINIPVNDVYRPGQRLAMLFRLTRSLRTFCPHIVLASQFGDAWYAGIAGRLCGSLVLIGVRSNGLAEMRAHGRRGVWMRRLGHALVTNSGSARANLIGLGVEPTRIQVLPNVIDLQHFDRQGLWPFPLPLAPERIVVAAIGRLHHAAKRHDRFLQALAVARRTVPALTGLIVGRDVGAKASLLQQAEALGLLPDGLLLLPETGEVPGLLRQVHMLALTSDYEGFPNVILEAMAAGLPVVATPAGEVPAIVDHGRTGYVVDFEDTDGLAQRLVQLAQSPELRGQLGQAGRRRVELDYALDGLLERFFAVLRTTAAHSRRRTLLRLLQPPLPPACTDPTPIPVAAPSEAGFACAQPAPCANSALRA